MFSDRLFPAFFSENTYKLIWDIPDNVFTADEVIWFPRILV